VSWKDKFPKENKYFETENGILYCANVLEILFKFPNESIDCIITSPPYWGLRDYQVEDQIGLEPSLEEYIEKLFEVMKELKRILKKTGVIFWNHGDCYGGNNSRASFGGRAGFGATRECVDKRPIPAKCMALQNYRFILRCVDELKLILRNIIIWYKPNHMPSSVKDRFTNAYEPIFMLAKDKKYWFDLDVVRVPHKTSLEKLPQKFGRLDPNRKGVQNAMSGIIKYQAFGHNLGKNPGDLWEIPTQPFPESHFATFPERLVEPMLKCACPQWICKKCGFIRERITKVERDFLTFEDRYSGKYKENLHSYARRDQRYIDKNGKFKIPKRYTVDWTDCGCNVGWESGIVLDPFIGSGTVAVVAERLNRRWIGIEINQEYCEMAKKRILKEARQLKFNFKT